MMKTRSAALAGIFTAAALVMGLAGSSNAKPNDKAEKHEKHGQAGGRFEDRVEKVKIKDPHDNRKIKDPHDNRRIKDPHDNRRIKDPHDNRRIKDPHDNRNHDRWPGNGKPGNPSPGNWNNNRRPAWNTNHTPGIGQGELRAVYNDGYRLGRADKRAGRNLDRTRHKGRYNRRTVEWFKKGYQAGFSSVRRRR